MFPDLLHFRKYENISPINGVATDHSIDDIGDDDDDCGGGDDDDDCDEPGSDPDGVRDNDRILEGDSNCFKSV